MKIPAILHKRLTSHTSELLLSQCLGDLYLQYLSMDQKSTAAAYEGVNSAPRSSISWHCDSSDTSRSPIEFVQTDEVMFSASDLQSRFLGTSSPVRSAESLVLSECEHGTDIFRDSLPKAAMVEVGKGAAPLSTCLREESDSAEVNPITYENYSGAWRPSFTIDTSSRTLPIAKSQCGDFLVASPSKARPPTGARVPDDGEGVSDAELAFSSDHQSDYKRGETGVGTNSMHGPRCSRSSEGPLFSRVKLMCSFGGRFVPRPYDGKLRYVGGVTRIVTVNKSIRYAELMYKLTESYGLPLILKYQLPDEDLDALVSVSSDDDLQNMMEEHDRLEEGSRSLRLRLFLFFAEYDEYHLQNTTEDDCRNSDQQYVDAINGIREKSFAIPFQSGRMEGRAGGDDILILRRGYSAEDIRSMHECISGMIHQPPAWPVSSTRNFVRSPSAPSSAPSSPTMALRQHPVVADISLQPFQNRLSKVIVQSHNPMRSEACLLDLDQVGSGGRCSRQVDRHLPLSGSQISPSSPGFEMATGEHIPTGDAITRLTELHGKSASVFEQYVEQGITRGAGQPGARSDAQQLYEMSTAQVDLHHQVFQQWQQKQQQCDHWHQHKLIPQQQQSAWQSSGDSQRVLETVETLPHCISDLPSQSQALQQPSLHATYFHPHDTTTDYSGVSRQGGQKLIHQEGLLHATALQRSVSSHAMAMGQQPNGLPCTSAYPITATAPSPPIALRDLKAQHHLMVKRAFSDSRIDQPHGRRVHFDDEANRNFQISAFLPQFHGNITADEWAVIQQQQLPAPLAISEAGFEELVGNSSQHLYEGLPASQCQLRSPHSLEHSDIFLPVLKQTKSQCPMACLENNTEASMQKLPPHQANSKLEYQNQMRQASELVPLHSIYTEEHIKSGEWNSTDIQRDYGRSNAAILCSVGAPSKLLPHSNEDLGNALEGGTCMDKGYNFYCNFSREEFNLPMLADGGIATIKTERLQPPRILPVSLYPSSREMHATNVRHAIIEELQVVPSSMSSMLSKSPRFPGTSVPGSTAVLAPERASVVVPQRHHYIPPVTSQALPGFYMLSEQQPLGLTSPKENYQSSIHISCSKNVSSNFGGASDPVDFLNEAHKLEETSACDEICPGNMHDWENHIATSASSPRGVVARIKEASDKNTSDETVPDLTSRFSMSLDCVQPSCENVSLQEKLPHALSNEKLSDSIGASIFPISMAATAVASPPSIHVASVQYPWHAVHPPALNLCEQDEVSTAYNLPIYDRSPVGSVSVAVSRDCSLVPDEVVAKDPVCISDKGTSVGRMSLTGRLAEDMICSVLESCGKAEKYEARGSGQEVVDKNSDDHDRNGRREEYLKSRTKPGVETASLSRTMQDRKRSNIQEEQFSREKMKVQAASEEQVEEREVSMEIKHEASEQIGDNDIDGAGKSIVNSCAAEVEAISRGLQTIKNADLEEIRELGSGTFGTVCYGKWRGSDVAIKRIKASCFRGPLTEQERLISDFWKEACTLGQLHHPNVVAFYGVVPDGPNGTLATVTEYMVNGSLKQVLHKKDRTIDRRKRLLIAMDAAFGMEYLHSKNIVHFDLKCENLLVNMRDPHRPICKVSDFGLSKVKQHTLVSGGVRGTLPWMAPELLSGNNNMVTEKIDVFSFGIVMWELLTGEEPYANMHCGAIIGGIVSNTLRPPVPSWCDPAWRSLMEKCWSGDPANRPTFSEVANELRAIAASMNLK